MNRRALPVLFLGSLLIATAASQTSQSVSKPAAAAEVAIPFELVNRHIIVKVQVNNSRSLSFILDTGDDVAIVDLARAKELGLKLGQEIRVGGAGADLLTGALVQESTFAVPGLEGFSQPVRLAIPLAQMAPPLGQDFDGIIGAEFIKEFVLEFDYQKRIIKLHDKNKFSYSGSGDNIPIHLDHGHPILEAEVTPIGGQPVKGRFVLDIGSGAALTLHSPFVAEHRLLGGDLKTIKSIGAGGTGGQVKGRLGRVAELKIGQYKIAGPITLFSEDNAGAFANAKLLGNIGGQIASRFRIFLDYSHQRIIFEPTAAFAAPFDRAFTGFSFVAEGKDYRTFRVREVLENSPASEAGLQQNDIITEVNGKPAVEFTLTQLSEMFERPVAYRLNVRRGEQTLQMTLTPRRLV